MGFGSAGAQNLGIIMMAIWKGGRSPPRRVIASKYGRMSGVGSIKESPGTGGLLVGESFHVLFWG